MKVNKIFNSFQGEGVYIGTPSTFLRLSGCNLNCSFCDTNFESYEEYTPQKLAVVIQKNMNAHHNKLLVVTGGEPLLQYDELEELINILDCDVQIETNGSIIKIPLDATYVISPKKNIEEVFYFYKDYSKAYFKFIICNDEDLDIITGLIYKYDYSKKVYLQPEYSNDVEITSMILDRKLNIDYIISGQLHKYLQQP